MVADAEGAGDAPCKENEAHSKQMENELACALQGTKPPPRDEETRKRKVNNLWRYSSVRLRIAVALALALTIEGGRGAF